MKKETCGFTVVELLIVIIILGAVASVAVPRLQNGVVQNKEAQLLSNLKLIRQSAQNFYIDTGYYPNDLRDLAATCAPLQVTADEYPGSLTIYPAGVPWQGPYLSKIPKCPFTSGDFQITTSSGPKGTLIFKIYSTATAMGSNGKAYNTW